MDYTVKMSLNDLIQSIDHWNEYRVPILRISHPDKNQIFQGAMRFYFQDSGQKVATKCVNVTSADTTKDVIDVLIEKFRPDMRMLSVPEYGLYEIHENGDERKLAADERPILVQLGWNKDDREGRFLLRRMDEKTRELAGQNEEPSLKKKLSKKEKKKQDKLKKQQQKEQEKADAAAKKLASKNKNGIAERLYNELPETSFTRSISNPEAVMKRRRAQKLEKRLQEFSLEGGQDSGGTLRIFGETINKDVSYKTLLLSTRDTASSVVKQILEKYGKDDEDPYNYCLVQLIVPPSAASSNGDNIDDLNSSAGLRESILEDHDCPLLINQNHDKSKGILTFHIRHKPADYQKRRKKKPSKAQVQQNPLHPLVVQQLNQRLQMNNNNNLEQYRDQNSPQTSSQTSGSFNHDLSNPLPPPFETIHSMPTMFPARNGTGGIVYYQQQQPHSISTSTLPSRVNNHHHSNMPEFSKTMQQPPYSHQNMMNNRQFTQNQIITNNHHTMPTHPQNQIPQAQQQYIPATGANDQILPALIQVKEDVEDIFLDAVVTRIEPKETPFRLAPTYVLYMVSRYRASTLFHPELQAPSRAELFMPFTKKIASMVRDAIETHMRDPTYLAFWLANSSDLSHFYKQDKHLTHFTIDAQEILYDSIKASFKYLLSCKQLELDAVLHTFFDEREDGMINIANGRSQVPPPAAIGTAINPILDVLNDTMATMRKNRVNAALTIQIFSHLFHHISKWLFDRLIGVYDNQPGLLGNQPNFSVYCNRIWGERLNRRLAAIGGWAEKQGLEQAADFHLARVTQVTLFLARRYPPRVSPNDLREACDSCDRLNPVQLRALLQRYEPEQPIIGAIKENLLYSMDYSYMSGDYPLEEDFELKIPFLIPEDGYSSELIRYIPNGLLDFVSYLSKIRIGDQELCIFTVQPTSSGHWTVYFKNHQPDSPEIVIIQLRKKNNSMGLSIIAARGVGQERLGIYIKNVVKGGAAAMDSRLQAGDQLLEVDGNSLLDITQEQAAELMTRTGPIVTLKVAKQAAIYHNVSDIINSVPTQTIVSPAVGHHPIAPALILPPPQAFVPPAPAPLEPIQPQPVILQSPIKSPKKVSWVDTQPHQSLHTLIPLPVEPDPIENMPTVLNGQKDIANYNGQEEGDEEEEEEEEEVEEEEEEAENNNNHLHRYQNNKHDIIRSREDREDDNAASDENNDDQDDDHRQNGHAKHIETNGNFENAMRPNGQADATEAGSLTVEDIDEVLGGEVLTNWGDESAGVIGTQEVYNDPRQRIARERERPKDDVNFEKLTLKDKINMFNVPFKK